MSVIIHTRGEVGGGVAAHLQCSFCGHLSRSHAHQLSHLAASHPTCLDDVAMGRLGNILIYQSTARLFHCAECFFTNRDFTKVYKHIISKHCEDKREGGVEDKGGEEEDALKRKQSSEEEAGEENDQGVVKPEEEAVKPVQEVVKTGEEVGKPGEEEVKPDGEGDQTVLMFDGACYRCLICGWKNKMKALGVNHVMRKHDIPKAYAAQVIKRDAPKQMTQRGGPEEEELAAGLSGELLKEEMDATAKVVRFTFNRFICLLCGWKSKLKGFAISHVERCHDVVRPYSCSHCTRSFLLPSRLQQHVMAAHRPGRYACPFCSFRSHFLGGFRRHCSRCNAREEEAGGGGAGIHRPGGGEDEEWGRMEEELEREDRKEARGKRKRRKTEKMRAEEEVEY